MLHLGHAWSAIVAHDLAKDRGGRFLLRVEDIDGARSKPELPDAFRRDLEWLGLEWEEVPAQSTRLANYEAAAKELQDAGLLYPCTCTRSEIAALKPRTGPEGLVYPGTCKGKSIDGGKPAALRLDVEKAMARVGEIVWDFWIPNGNDAPMPYARGAELWKNSSKTRPDRLFHATRLG